MAVVGFSFKKISIERKEEKGALKKIDNNAKILEVKRVPLNVVPGGPKQESLRISFEFKAKYNPDIAEIIVAGSLIWADTEENIKSAEASWKKDKKLPGSVMIPMWNAMFHRSLLQAAYLSKELNLQPPFDMPRLKPDKQ
jgi:hypothetical protein